MGNVVSGTSIKELEQQKRDELIKTYLDELAQIDRNILLAKSKDDYASYVEYVHQGNYVHGKHIDYICKILEKVENGEIKRLMVFLPPGHSKSETVTKTFPTWYIGRNPDREVIEISYNMGLAEEFGYLNKQKVEMYGKQIFGIEISGDKEAKASWRIKNRKGGMESRGFGGDITGRRANLLIIDDPVKNQEEADSETIRNSRYNEYRSTILTRLYPDASVILIQTRWHHEDLAGRILAEEKDVWTVINMPFFAEDNDPLGREPGEELWPEFGFTKEWAEGQKRALGSRAWNALYQQRPSPEEGGMIKREWFNRFTFDPHKKRFDKLIQSWDCTFKDSDGTDYVVGQVWGTIGADRYLVDMVRERMDLPATIQAVRDMSAKWPEARLKLVEDKANGPAVIQSLRRELSGLVAFNPKGSKEARVQAVLPDIEAGNVWIPQSAMWAQDFLEECCAFPNGAHDDMVDSMSMALIRLLNAHDKKSEVGLKGEYLWTELILRGHKPREILKMIKQGGLRVLNMPKGMVKNAQKT